VLDSAGGDKASIQLLQFEVLMKSSQIAEFMHAVKVISIHPIRQMAAEWGRVAAGEVIYVISFHTDWCSFGEKAFPDLIFLARPDYPI